MLNIPIVYTEDRYGYYLKRVEQKCEELLRDRRDYTQADTPLFIILELAREGLYGKVR